MAKGGGADNAGTSTIWAQGCANQFELGAASTEKADGIRYEYTCSGNHRCN